MKDILTIIQIRKNKKQLYLGLTKRGFNNISYIERELAELLLKDQDVQIMIRNQDILESEK